MQAVIELTDLRVSNYVLVEGRMVRLRPEDLLYPKHISGIAITPVRLNLLGFELEKGTRVKYWRDHKVMLTPVKMGWKLTCGELTQTIQYIHQLQNFWYACFQDELFRPLPPKTFAANKPADRGRDLPYL